MDYELALELKNAGFPQSEYLIDGEFLKSPTQNVGYHLLRENADRPDYDALNDITMPLQYWNENYLRGEGAKYIVYIPTLSELIEECNKSPFFELSKLADGWGANDHYMKGTGSTPEEAVANLYLALHAKE